MQIHVSLVLAFIFLLSQPVCRASIIGSNSPALPLTLTRIKSLPTAQQQGWLDYLSRSESQAKADRQSFFDETRRGNSNIAITSPPSTRGTRGIPLGRPATWYRSADALRLAENIVSYQTPSGGWSKNIDMTDHRRAKGEFFAAGNLNRFAGSNDLDAPRDANWDYVGTFDNGATTTQLRYLAKMAQALDEPEGKIYRDCFSRGLGYIYSSQYPNGGWPQVWPLQGGYHDAITFNDGAMTSVLELLADIAGGEADFSFVSAQQREQAAAAMRRGLDCVLKSQFKVGEQLMVWGQQHDALTLLPTAARNYEMASLASGESAGLLLFLMRQPANDKATGDAIEAAVAWFKRTAIYNKAYDKTAHGRDLLEAPGQGPIWSRYYDLTNSRPIFGERDKTIRDTVGEISQERRDGYAWFTDGPQSALKQYEKWRALR